MSRSEEPDETFHHPSDSAVQRRAEGLILAELSSRFGVVLEQRVELELGDASVEVDGVDKDQSYFVEVFSRVGTLKGGQVKKVSEDALKLMAVGENRPNSKLVLAFASHEAADSIRGWRSAVISALDIQIEIVELGPGEQAKIEAVQIKQRMENPDP